MSIFFYTPIERYSIRWYWVLGIGYWVLGIRYWCLSVISVNFIYLRIVKNRDRKKSSDANTQPGQAGIEY
jgi:hypothetical protein